MADWGRGQSPSAVDDMLDVENKRMADNLATKVTRLKSLALDIDKDAEDQTRYLDGTDTDFMSVTGLLTGSVKRFSTMTRSGRDNRRLLCYVSGGLGFSVLDFPVRIPLLDDWLSLTPLDITTSLEPKTISFLQLILLPRQTHIS
ncbi:BET1-like protein isoform X1 [Carettochelys insculpta]|uniref:BET1-like protein isoform X1 n=1 Tax=Carettochelys insculpta TaxID=44489 RepID=UPI003EBE37C4